MDGVHGSNDKVDAIIKCSIHNHKKGYRIYIWEESMIIVRNHIHQYMHKDMLYKINPPLPR